MHKLTDPGKILLRKCGNEIQTLSSFSKTKNIFNRFVEGNNCSFFMDKDMPFEKWQDGELFHEGWDDFAPWMTAEYGTVGANHGSPFAYLVEFPQRHWFFETDIGKIFTDDAGNRFILVNISDGAAFVVHGEAFPGEKPMFKTLQGDLYDNGKKLNAVSIKKIQLPYRAHKQLARHCRYNKITLTADGKTVPENSVIECSSAVLCWDMDICLADSLLEYIKAHPGRDVYPFADGIVPAIHQDMKITFQPASAYTVEADIRFLRDFNGMHRWGMLQHYGTIGFAAREKFIPKLKPFETVYGNGETVKLDFNRPALMTGAVAVNNRFRRADCLDPDDPPLRYMELYGDGNVRQLGVVLGFSPVCGATAKNSPDRGDYLLTLPVSNKVYPCVYASEYSPAGKTFYVSGYRQYFDPSASAAASFGHYEADGYWFYANYDRSAAEELELPKELAGAEFEIMEIEGDVTLPASGKADSNAALAVSVREHGVFALRFPGKKL